jgi:hypothetical protein
MNPVFPIPTLDHVVINARDQLDRAADIWQRLGFTLTPRGFHTLGSMNHLAMFGTDYLELIAIQPGNTNRPEIMESPPGLSGLVFGTENADATFQALRDNGVPINPPNDFSRPVEGLGDAAFRTTRLPRTATPFGQMYFCQHKTRPLVWRDEWRHHANGTVGIARAVIAADDPASIGALFAQMFGPDTVQPLDDGYALAVGLSRFDVVTPAALWEMFGAAAPESRGRGSYMAALTFRVLSLNTVERVLDAGGIAGWDRIGTSVLVPASGAGGVTVEFGV